MANINTAHAPAFVTPAAPAAAPASRIAGASEVGGETALQDRLVRVPASGAESERLKAAMGTPGPVAGDPALKAHLDAVRSGAGQGLPETKGKAACHCTAVDGSKESQSKETWFGHRRTVTAKYDCSARGVTETVKATHKEWWLHKDTADTGREGNMLGQTYGTAVYNNVVGRYTYPQTGFQSFNPAGSDAPQLDAWAKAANCTAPGLNLRNKGR